MLSAKRLDDIFGRRFLLAGVGDAVLDVEDDVVLSVNVVDAFGLSNELDLDAG